jgi:hypothetical protein
MNPSASLRQDDCCLTGERGIGMVFAKTPDSPRIAYLPLVWTCDDAVHFDMARLSLITSGDACTIADAGLAVQDLGSMAQHRRRLGS